MHGWFPQALSQGKSFNSLSCPFLNFSSFFFIFKWRNGCYSPAVKHFLSFEAFSQSVYIPKIRMKRPFALLLYGRSLPSPSSPSDPTLGSDRCTPPGKLWQRLQRGGAGSSSVTPCNSKSGPWGAQRAARAGGAGRRRGSATGYRCPLGRAAHRSAAPQATNPAVVPIRQKALAKRNVVTQTECLPTVRVSRCGGCLSLLLPPHDGRNTICMRWMTCSAWWQSWRD